MALGIPAEYLPYLGEQFVTGVLPAAGSFLAASYATSRFAQSPVQSTPTAMSYRARGNPSGWTPRVPGSEYSRSAYDTLPYYERANYGRQMDKYSMSFADQRRLFYGRSKVNSIHDRFPLSLSNWCSYDWVGSCSWCISWHLPEPVLCSFSPQAKAQVSCEAFGASRPAPASAHVCFQGSRIP